MTPNSIQEALQRYQTKMRPYVDKCQDIPNRVDRYAPNSASDIAMNIGVMKWMQRWPFRPIAAKLWFTAADSIELPDYSTVRLHAARQHPAELQQPLHLGQPAAAT